MLPVENKMTARKFYTFFEVGICALVEDEGFELGIHRQEVDGRLRHVYAGYRFMYDRCPDCYCGYDRCRNANRDQHGYVPKFVSLIRVWFAKL
jgi:hypothetical protein